MNNVLILPKICDQKLLAKYYSMADVFTICSKRENFPTTCIEAQCCGTPVVGFDTGGTKETSVLSEDDFVNYGDLLALQEKIMQRTGEDKDKIVSKAQNAYSKETMTKNYLKEYDRNGKKKRILLIDVNCKGSSTGKIVYDLYNSIRADGRTAAICYGRGLLVKGENIYKFGLDWETMLHAGLARITGYNGIFSYLSTKRLIKYIEEFRPDLIHIHELHAYFVNLKMLIEYIKKKKIPLIWTFHCEYMYTGKCGHAYECEGFQNKCGDCPAIKEYPKSFWFDRTKTMLAMKKKLRSDLDFSIITPSKWLADRVRLSFLKEKKIKVIHNGIDTEVFHYVDANNLKRELNIPNEYKIVLAVAPDIMSERKGGEWILKIADRMKEKKIFFLLVGRK